MVIGKTAVGIGVQRNDLKCEWDSAPYTQNGYTTRHKHLIASETCTDSFGNTHTLSSLLQLAVIGKTAVGIGGPM